MDDPFEDRFRVELDKKSPPSTVPSLPEPTPSCTSPTSDQVPPKNRIERFRQLRQDTVKQIKAIAKDARTRFSNNNTKGRPKTFGIPFSEAPCFDIDECIEKGEYEKIGVPSLVISCIDYLEKDHLSLVGLFRVPGSHAEVKLMRDMINNGEYVNFYDESLCKSPHSVAALLKLYLRELPEPLLTFELYDVFLATINTFGDSVSVVKTLKKVVSFLPLQNLLFLIYLLRFLRTVSEHSDENKMTSSNIAMVFSPNILSASKTSDAAAALVDSGHASKVVEAMITDFEEIFGDYNLQSLGIQMKESIEKDQKELPDEAHSPGGQKSVIQNLQEKIAKIKIGNMKNLTLNLKKLSRSNSKKLDSAGSYCEMEVTLSKVPSYASLKSPIPNSSPPEIKSVFGPRENPFLNSSKSAQPVDHRRSAIYFDSVQAATLDYLPKSTEILPTTPPVAPPRSSKQGSMNSLNGSATNHLFVNDIPSPPTRNVSCDDVDDLSIYEDAKTSETIEY